MLDIKIPYMDYDIGVSLAYGVGLFACYFVGEIANRIRFRNMNNYLSSGEHVLWRTKRGPLFTMALLIIAIYSVIIFLHRVRAEFLSSEGFTSAIVISLSLLMVASLFCETVITENAIYHYSVFTLFQVRTFPRSSAVKAYFAYYAFGMTLVKIVALGRELSVFAYNGPDLIELLNDNQGGAE